MSFPRFVALFGMPPKHASCEPPINCRQGESSADRVSGKRRVAGGAVYISHNAARVGSRLSLVAPAGLSTPAHAPPPGLDGRPRSGVGWGRAAEEGWLALIGCGQGHFLSSPTPPQPARFAGRRVNQ